MRKGTDIKLHILIHALNTGICCILKKNAYLRNCDAVIEVLKNKGYLPDYSKSTDVFTRLYEYQQVAIQRAMEREEQLKKNQIETVSRDSNPSTTVYTLVEFLSSQGQQ